MSRAQGDLFKEFTDVAKETRELLERRLTRRRYERISRFVGLLEQGVRQLAIAAERVSRSENNLVADWQRQFEGKRMNVEEFLKAYSERFFESIFADGNPLDTMRRPMDEFRFDLDALYTKGRAVCDQVIQLVTNAVQPKGARTVSSLHDFVKHLENQPEHWSHVASFFNSYRDDLIWLATTFKVFRDKASIHVGEELQQATSHYSRAEGGKVGLQIQDDAKERVRAEAIRWRERIRPFVEGVDPNEQDPVRIASIISSNLHKLPKELRDQGAISFVERVALTSASPGEILERLERVVMGALRWVAANSSSG